MASVLANYIATDANTGASFNLTGMLSYADRGPAHPIAPGGQPPHPAHPIAPGGEHPAHPIAPGGEHPAHPIAPGGDPIELPHPEHPITLPPTEPPTQPADPSWVWGFNPTQGWLPVYVPGPTDPQPHA